MSDKKGLNIVILSVIFILQFVIAYFLLTKVIFKNQLADEKKLSEKTSETETKDENKSKGSEEDVDKQEAMKDYAKNFAVLTLDTFQEMVVNPQNSNGHILMISIGLEYILKEKKLPDELNVKMAILRNDLNLLLAEQSLDDLYNYEYRETLAGKMLETLNKSLTDGQLTGVFITDYIIQ